MKAGIYILALLFTYSCQGNNQSNKTSVVTTLVAKKPKTQEKDPAQDTQLKTAYFAAGCFWCVEAIFESVKGVKEAVSGYAGGKEKDPDYETVSYGKTTHAEAVAVYYDPKVISFTALVQVFFGSHDPTTLNRQGPDRGPQYRSIAFYQNEQEKEVIEAYIQALKDQDVYQGAPITTEVMPLDVFYKAEEYHQDYEKKHPNNSYIRNVSIPRLNRFKANFTDFLKEDAH